LDARLHADHVADVFLESAIELDEKIDGPLLAVTKAREILVDENARLLDLEIRVQLDGESLVVAEGVLARSILDEEVEGVDADHLGDEIDLDDELPRGLGKDEPGQVVAVRILLPVEEMLARLDLQRIADDRRATMRRGPQPHDLRQQRHRAVVEVL